MNALKPFLMLASVAFVTGFSGYLAVAKVNELTSPAYSVQAPIEAMTQDAAPADTWNVAKRI